MGGNKVILLGVDTPIGLSLIRELKQHGVSVYGIGSSHKSIGASSNQLHRFLIREKTQTSLINQITELQRSENVNAIMAISENDIEILNNNRGKLSKFNLLIPNQSQMDKVLSKPYSYGIAESIGIKCPRTWNIEIFDDLESLSSEISFPVVLKWANPQDIIKSLSKEGIEFIKTEHINSYCDLKTSLSRYQSIGSYPMIQTYCPGFGLGQFFLVKQGRIVQRFQHQRIHEWPPEGGVSTYCQAIPDTEHQELLQKSESLLKELDWDGVAMVEYRHDPSTGTSYLMEINGRFWGSYPLASQAGAHFGWLLYATGHLGQKEIKGKTITSDLSCRFMIPETKRLLRVLFQKQKIEDQMYVNTPMKDAFSYFLNFFRPSCKYYVFNWRDPKPMITDLINALIRR